MIAAPSLFPKPENEAKMANVILQTLNLWANVLRQSGHRQLIHTYATRRGCKVSELSPNHVHVETPSSACLLLDFEPSGACGLQIPKRIKAPNPRKASWLGRLLGG